LDFLGAWPFRREKPFYRLLDFLGFPWNLSSESRLINGLRGTNDQKFFLSLLAVAAGGAWTVAHNLGVRINRIAHGASLSLIFDFQQ
jgi:hypothetical protein